MDQGQKPPQQEPFGLEDHTARPSATASSSTPSSTENERLLAGLSYLSQVIVPAVLPVILMLTDGSPSRLGDPAPAAPGSALLPPAEECPPQAARRWGAVDGGGAPRILGG